MFNALVLNIGLCLFAAQHPDFPCHKVANFAQKNKINQVAILWGTFGNETACVTRLANSMKVIQIHFSNESCRRNKRCYRGELFRHLNATQYNYHLVNNFRRLKPKILQRVKKINKLVLTHPTVQWIISTGLEDNYSQRAYNRLYRVIKRGVPLAKVSRNPVDIRQCRGLCEYHSSSYPGTPIYSNDGCFISDLDGRQDGCIISASRMRNNIREAERNQSTVFIWWGKIQGLSSGQFVQPRKRDFKFTKSDRIVLKYILKGTK